MTPEELLKMLDLAGKEAGADKPVPLVAPAGTGPPRSTHRTALEVDEWGLRRGRDLVEASERLRELCTGEHAAADFHAAAFDPDPTLRDGCADRRRWEFLRQLLETPEYRSLHAETMLRAAAAEVAAVAFAEQFAELAKAEAPEESKEEAAKGVKEAVPAGETEMATMKAVCRALRDAREGVDEVAAVEGAFGMGPGSPGSNDPRALAALFRRVRGDPTLRRICDLAGRYRRVAQSKQRQKLLHGVDDMVGVVLDGDLGRLLPHELARLALPEFEDDALRRLVERQAMCREYRSAEPVAKGPILVTVDESGSMQGDRVHTAKALALALAWVARQQRRWCGLVAYSGDTGERLLPLPPGRWEEGALADWLTRFLGGGSDLDVPIAELPDYYHRLGAPPGVTDVLLLTDAVCRIPDAMRERFLAWKELAKARVHALILNTRAGDLAAVSDEVYLLATLDVTEEGVEKALSI
jgi:uncharacterized protein with von Willebrand factor type A (vWA) domain